MGSLLGVVSNVVFCTQRRVEYKLLYSKRRMLRIRERERERERKRERERVGLLWLTQRDDRYIQSLASQSSFTGNWFRASSRHVSSHILWMTCLHGWLPILIDWQLGSKNFCIYFLDAHTLTVSGATHVIQFRCPSFTLGRGCISCLRNELWPGVKG